MTIGKIWLKDVIMHYVLENHYKSQGHNCMLSCLKAEKNLNENMTLVHRNDRSVILLVSFMAM